MPYFLEGTLIMMCFMGAMGYICFKWGFECGYQRALRIVSESPPRE